MRVRVAARGAPRLRWNRHAAQQDGRAPGHSRHRRFRLPFPPTLPHAHVRENCPACAARPTGNCILRHPYLCKHSTR